MRRAVCPSLDAAEAYQALLEADGNITAAARKLGVPTSDFRTFARLNKAVGAASFEAQEQALDEAEAALLETLRGADQTQRLHAAATIVRTSPAALRRGFSGTPRATGQPVGRPLKARR